METRARHVLIGLFTLVATVLIALFVLWLSKSQRDSNYYFYDVAFEEAVSGLSRGSTVEFNGIKVGDVVSLRLDSQNPKAVYARVRVESSAPVRTDTQAMLIPIGITGTSLIRLSSGNSQTSRPLASSADSIPLIKAIPSPMSKLLAGGGDILYNFNKLLGNVNKIFSEENINNLNRTLAHIEQTTNTLSGQRDTLTKTIAEFNRAGTQASAAFGEMNTLMRSGNQLVSGELKQTLTRANNAAASFEKSMGTLESMLQENRAPINNGVRGLSQIGPTLMELRETLNTLQGTIHQLDNNPAGSLLNREPIKEFTP